jgi:hypothetical protein
LPGDHRPRVPGPTSIRRIRSICSSLLAATSPSELRTPAGARREELRYQLEIFALCGFAFAQPLLDVFGRNLEAFTLRGAGRLQIVLFGLAVTIVPWLVLGGAALVTRLAGATVRRWVQVGLLGLLAGLITLTALKRGTDVRGVLLALLPVVVGVGFGYVYARWRLLGLWARYASVAPVLFLVLFLVASPVSTLVFPSDARAVAVEGTELPRHVVFLLFDELPTASLIGADGQIDGARFPNFRRLADRSTWYRNYSSVSGSTKFAVPALLSGQYPRDELATADAYPDNLFTLLGDEYDVRADEVMTALCPDSVCGGTNGGIEALRQLTGDAWKTWREQTRLQDSDRPPEAGFLDETVPGRLGSRPARFDDFLEQLGEGGGRTLDFLHLLFPHQPWRLYPSGAQYPYPGRDPGLAQFVTSAWRDDPRPPELGRQRHLLQTQWVDGLVGETIDTLEERGIFDDTLIVVTADHGVAFRPGEEPRPGMGGDQFPADTYEQIMWAPLLIKAPHQRAAETSDDNVESIDLLPTILQRVGIAPPDELDGVPAGERRGDEKVYAGSETVGFSRTALGHRYRVDGAEGLRRVLADHQRAFAPSPDARWAFYRVGPYADLVGRPVTALRTGSPSSLDVTVDDADRFDDVDPSEGSVPGLVTGEAHSPDEAVVAVVVNGTVAGVSSTFPDDQGPEVFAVIVPDFLFRPGTNDVRLFAVEGTGAAAVLRPLDA